MSGISRPPRARPRRGHRRRHIAPAASPVSRTPDRETARSDHDDTPRGDCVLPRWAAPAARPPGRTANVRAAQPPQVFDVVDQSPCAPPVGSLPWDAASRRREGCPENPCLWTQPSVLSCRSAGVSASSARAPSNTGSSGQRMTRSDAMTHPTTLSSASAWPRAIRQGMPAQISRFSRSRPIHRYRYSTA